MRSVCNVFRPVPKSVLVIWPNVRLLIFVSGFANSGWLNTLKASARNSTFRRSAIAVVLASAKSRFVRPARGKSLAASRIRRSEW